MNNQFLTITDLQYEIKHLREKVESFESGERYLKVQNDYSRMCAGYARTIEKLKKELESERRDKIKVRDIWFEENCKIWDEYRKDINQYEDKIRKLSMEIQLQKYKYLDEIDGLKKTYKEQMEEKDEEIKALKDKIAHLQAVLNQDSTNTSKPTSQTPINKNKLIPNGREKTGKRKGGQPGHVKSELPVPSEEEITDTEKHCLGENDVCPECYNDKFEYTGKWEVKYEKELVVTTKITKHVYYLYKCLKCGTIVKLKDHPEQDTKCRYGANVQAMALDMMNVMNAPINKIPDLFFGLTNGAIHPCEGYIAKVQKRAAKNLCVFYEELKKRLMKQSLIYWDDTVVYADTKRICLRFYGDDSIAFFVAHEKKDLEGIVEDGILTVLSDKVKVMHDHYIANYNGMFCFINLECNAHLQRDLQKIAEITGHEIFLKIKELISKTIKERKQAIQKGETEFSEEYEQEFEDTLSLYLKEAEKLAEGNESKYSGGDERALVRRMIEYRKNYFAWVNNFEIPTTNNLSERALRGAKTKMKVSGQFASVETANNYAKIRSYIETCRKNGINEYEALVRLCNANPYTMSEIFG